MLLFQCLYLLLWIAPRVIKIQTYNKVLLTPVPSSLSRGRGGRAGSGFLLFWLESNLWLMCVYFCICKIVSLLCSLRLATNRHSFLFSFLFCALLFWIIQMLGAIFSKGRYSLRLKREAELEKTALVTSRNLKVFQQRNWPL